MGIGIFLDKEHEPTALEITAVLGSTLPLWERLRLFLSDNYQMEGDFSFGGKKYGWNYWYRKSGKSLVSLYPQQGYFVAQIVLGKEQAEKTQAMKFGKNVGRIFKETPQLHDGRWLFIPVHSEDDVRDVEQLLLIKKRPVKR